MADNFDDIAYKVTRVYHEFITGDLLVDLEMTNILTGVVVDVRTIRVTYLDVIGAGARLCYGSEALKPPYDVRFKGKFGVNNGR